MYINIFKYSSILIILIFFSACTSKELNININNKLKIPTKYNNTSKNLEIQDKWILSFKDEELINLINKALNKNFQLKQLFYDIEIKKQELIYAKSSIFPSIDLSLNQSKNGEVKESNSSNLSKIGLGLDYEIDLWGKLSDANKKANINILETQAIYEQAKQQLAHDIAIAYYDIKESSNLLDIYNKHLINTKRNYEIIKSRYKQGLNTALDTYLAQNSIYSKIRQVKDIQTTKSQAVYKLEQLLGEYPKGKLNIKKELPIINSQIKLGIPSELILRKPSLTASWNNLLAQNYQLAFTHKQRLPSLNLSASLEQTSKSGTPISWSILGGLTAPIFNAGKLEANEKIEHFELKKAELDYLDKVYTAFIEIENLILKEKSLKEQYQVILKAKENSKKSSTLSLNQYLKGLINYSTVLDTQDSYYSSEIELIEIKKQLLDNRIALHLALGGDFISEEKNIKEIK